MLKAILFIFFVLVLSSSDIFLAKKGIIPVDPSVMISGIAAIYTIIYFGSKKFRDNFSKEIENQFPKKIWFYILYAITSILFTLHPGAYFEEDGYTSVLLPTFNLILIFFVFYSIVYYKLNFFKYVIIFAFIVSVSSIILEVFIPGLFSKVASRSAGLSVNPNASGIRIMILASCLLIFKFKRENLVHSIIIFLSGLSVFFTFSRGSLLIFIVFLVVYLYFFHKERILKTTLKVSILIFSIIFFLELLGFSLTKLPIFQSNGALVRLNMVTGQSEFVNSDDSRLKIADEYWKLILQNPILGHGIGSINNHSILPICPHNLYLKIWFEQGFIIFVVYIVFILRTMFRLYFSKDYNYLLLFIVISMGGLFTHNLFDNRSMIIALGIFFFILNRKNQLKDDTIILSKSYEKNN